MNRVETPDVANVSLSACHDDLFATHRQFMSGPRRLDMTRGKPSPEQLDLVQGLLTLPGENYRAADGTDTRNYGGLEGLPEVREIFAPLLSVEASSIIAAGNSSLQLMHDTLVMCLLHGVGGQPSWREQAAQSGKPIKFICPVPGYDRHFSLSQHYGIEMIPVPLYGNGPDLDQVAELAADPMVKGMWVVPMYSNPTGVTYDHAHLRGLLSMPAADDFRIFFDNAYALHHLSFDEPKAPPLLEFAAEVGHPDRACVYFSTSKITMAGAGVSFVALSPADKEWFLGHRSVATIGPDKVNQLRHAQFFATPDGVRRHMRLHRDVLWPKFEAVETVLRDTLAPARAATWSHPAGGYFVSLDVPAGCAKRTVELAEQAGVALTPAGATFPYRTDPADSNIRLAPSMPPVDEITVAMEVVSACVLLAISEQVQ